MSAADAFVPLADLLRRPAVHEIDAAPQNPAPAVAEPCTALASNDAHSLAASVAAIREARVFRARLADALDARLAKVLASVAGEIVCRELRTAPADLAALVARIAGEHTLPPLAVRVAPADRDALATPDVCVIEDDTLDAGDAIVVFAAGEIDARLGVRLASVLEALR